MTLPSKSESGSSSNSSSNSNNNNNSPPSYSTSKSSSKGKPSPMSGGKRLFSAATTPVNNHNNSNTSIHRGNHGNRYSSSSSAATSSSSGSRRVAFWRGFLCGIGLSALIYTTTLEMRTSFQSYVSLVSLGVADPGSDQPFHHQQQQVTRWEFDTTVTSSATKQQQLLPSLSAQQQQQQQLRRSHESVMEVLARAAAEQEETEEKEDEEEETQEGEADTEEEDTEEEEEEQQGETQDDDNSMFPEGMQDFLHGFGSVNRQDFYQKFDVGYGLDPDVKTNNRVLIMYNHPDSLPTDANPNNADGGILEFDSVDQATEHCDEVKVIMTQPVWRRNDKEKPRHEHKECMAIVSQWDSYHVHRFTKQQSKTTKTKNGKKQFHYTASHPAQELPETKHIDSNHKALATYLNNVDEGMAKLKPLAKQASLGSNGKTKGPVIVMVTNYGQANLFMNFVCAAKARGVDLSRVLLFATDQDTYQLATDLGVHVFYDPILFGNMPTEASKDYFDHNYALMMMTKVYCVHMVSALGHDLLFADVDLVFYRDPLPFFQQPEQREFDMLFQHDGGHHPDRFAPLAANTGFYFVRNNERTRHFFATLVRMGDLVLANRSHQSALTTLANEHMSLRGLRVKVLQEPKDKYPRFPTGYHYHTGDRVMGRMKRGIDKGPLYVFHTNWMDGDKKQGVLEEHSNWFVDKDKCYDKNVNDLHALLKVESNNKNKKSSNGSNTLMGSCCLAEPLGGYLEDK